MEALQKENRRRLWNSLEMGDVKRNILIFVILLPIFYIFSMARFRDPEPRIWMDVIMTLLILPFLIFYLVRLVNILRQAENYLFCQAVLDKPHASLNRDMFYFSVVLKGADGKEFMTDTHAIIANRILVGPQLEDYVNQTVTVAYNPATGMVVVIG